MPGISDPGERLVAAAVGGRPPRRGRARPVGRDRGAGGQRAADRAGSCSRASCRARARAGPSGWPSWPASARTIVLYEAPHRLARTLADLAAALGGDRRVVLARELTKLHEEIWRGTLAEAGRAVRPTVEPRGEYVAGRRRRAGAARRRPTTSWPPRSAPRSRRAGRPRTRSRWSPAASACPRRRVYDLATRR